MTFIDSNVFIYSVDKRNPENMRIAREIITAAVDNQTFTISQQVLNEFANVSLKKLSMTVGEVRECIEEFLNINVAEQRLDWTCKALDIKRRYNIQFYDSLLLAAASDNGCDEILTEDLADGQTYCGVRAVNPFK
ncbi:MAG: PIN domain-containing protein [Kiritimatiellae bacterium]|nr:PIN domain-containing protein [Kiritimatiellia bacterium]